MAWAEILAAITEYVGDDKAKAKEVAQSLRDTVATKPIAQLLINAGAGRKKGESDAELKRLEGEVQKLTEANEALTEQLETAQKAPTEQQASWERERKKLTDAKDRAEKERDAEREGRTTDAVELSVSRFLGSLRGRVDDFGLDALERRFRGRFRPAKASENGGTRVEVLDSEGDPIEAPKGKTPEEVLAEEAYEVTPSANRVRNANSGSGAGSGGDAGGKKVSREEIEVQKDASGEYRM